MKCYGVQQGFLDRANLAGEQLYFSQIYEEIINLYGIEISYFSHGYQLSAHDFIYGEHPTAPFSGPIKMKGLLMVNDDAQLLSKFGITTQSDCQMIIGIKQFADFMGNINAEPIDGSLVRLDFMDQRPGGKGYPNDAMMLSAITFCKNPDEYQSALNDLLSSTDMGTWLRSAPIYEITLKKDYAPQKNLNPLGTYSVWYMDMIRWDYSYEPNAPRESGSNQVSDSTLYGKLSGGTPTAEPPKKYPQNIDTASKQIWDYDSEGKNRDRCTVITNELQRRIFF